VILRPAPELPSMVAGLPDMPLEKNRHNARVVKLGTIISEFVGDSEYDIPTFVRRQQAL